MYYMGHPLADFAAKHKNSAFSYINIEYGKKYFFCEGPSKLTYSNKRPRKYHGKPETFVYHVPCLSNTFGILNIFTVWSSSVFDRGVKILGQYSRKGIVFGISYVFRRWKGANCRCVSDWDIWNNNTAVFAFQRHPFHMFLLKQDRSQVWKMWESTKGFQRVELMPNTRTSWHRWWW